MPGRPANPDQPKQPVLIPTGVELDRILTEQQYAEMDGVSVFTVRRRSARGEGARRIRLSQRRVGYRLRDILAARQQIEEVP